MNQNIKPFLVRFGIAAVIAMCIIPFMNKRSYSTTVGPTGQLKQVLTQSWYNPIDCGGFDDVAPAPKCPDPHNPVCPDYNPPPK